jgi:hypothetical protein
MLPKMEYAGIGDKKGIYFIDDLPYLPYRYEKIYNKGVFTMSNL